jgi:hypothetical protein
MNVLLLDYGHDDCLESRCSCYGSVSHILSHPLFPELNHSNSDGYEFLMQNCELKPHPQTPTKLTNISISSDTSGDRICIFGFSRGAYTARALAGMIHKVGLLPACNHQQVPFAYKMFTRADDLGWKQSNAFKKCFSVDVDIEFIGVWYVLF